MEKRRRSFSSISYKNRLLATICIPGLILNIIATSCSNHESLFIPEELLLLKEIREPNSKSSKYDTTYILVNIDCGSCMERRADILQEVNKVRKNMDIPFIILRGESLGLFMEHFPDVFETETAILYDRYNVFSSKNKINIPPYPVKAQKKRKRIVVMPL